MIRRKLSQHSAPPTPEGSSGLIFRITSPFHGLRPIMTGSAPSLITDSLHDTDCCFVTPSRSNPFASAHQVTPEHRKLTTRLPDNYRDRTFTGKLTTAFQYTP
ncbi:MAG: hypothetical protein HQM08_29655 [Candidatus Riflebacteria bacterium]|nr:hypothetical protein [Candidatus Riflebacteria bacterium]